MELRNLNASICGERIFTQARKYTRRPDHIKSGKRLVRYVLETNAKCVIDRPLRLLDGAPPGAAVAAGTMLHAERIAAEALKVDDLAKTTGSSTHKIQQKRFVGEAMCVISRPLQGLH